MRKQPLKQPKDMTTPRPWKIVHTGIYGYNGEYIIRDMGREDYVGRMDGSTMSGFDQKANAQLIVKAVNSFDVMKAAIESALLSAPMTKQQEQAWPRLKAALELAEKSYVIRET